MSKINEFKKITESMADTYERKNVDYGDSFGESFKEFGLISSVVRMNDKMNRLKSFVTNGDYQVKDESVKDTLLDLANYCIMTVIELNNQAQK